MNKQDAPLVKKNKQTENNKTKRAIMKRKVDQKILSVSKHGGTVPNITSQPQQPATTLTQPYCVSQPTVLHCASPITTPYRASPTKTPYRASQPTTPQHTSFYFNFQRTSSSPLRKTTLSVKLAREAFFGDTVMAKYTPRQDMPALPHKELSNLKMLLFNLLSH